MLKPKIKQSPIALIIADDVSFKKERNETFSADAAK
jgi:hypothetical protein